MARPIGYTGYYPGERIPRPPGGGRPQPPITYDLNVLAQSIEEMEIAVGNIPKWTAERFTKAIESNLKATIYGGTIDASNLAAYDEEELAEEFSEISGTAGFAVNLNPADIAKDPKKWASKLVEEAYSELTSLSDIESRKRKNIWRDVVGLKGNGDTAVRDLTSEDTVIRDLTKRRALRRAGVEDHGNVDNYPLDLTHINGYEKEGRAVAEKIVDFQGNIRTVNFRDKNFDIVLRTSFAGTRKVLANNVERLEGDDQRFVLSFLSKIDLAQNVKSVDKAAEDIIKTIGRLRGLSAEENPVDKKGRPISLEGSIADLQLQVDKSRGQIQLMTGRTGSVLSKQEAQRLGPHIRRYERSLNRIEKTISDPTRIRGDGLFVRRLSAVTSDLAGQGSGGRYNSIERAYLRSLGDEFTRGSASGIAGDDRIEDLIRGVDENGYQYIRRNRMVLPTLEKDRQFFAVDDFMDVLYKDNFYSKFLWAAKINPRLRALTPDYYVKQLMVKMHYFGLVVDEGSIVGPNGELIKPKFFLFKWANKMIDKSQKKGGAFANKFSIEIKGFGNHIVKGGNRFGAVQNLSKLIKSESFNAGKMAALMGADGIMGMKGTLARLNLPFDDLSVEKLLKFQAWAKENAQRLGINWESGEDMMKVVRGLAAYDNSQIRNIGIGITKAYRGKLQQFVQKLSVLQNKVFGSFLGKVAGKLVSWKMAISVAVSEAVMDALGIATGGAAFLLKPLQLLLQAAIKIALDIGEKFVMSIVKADFGELSKFLDKSLTNVVKFLAQISAAITIAAVIPFLIVTTLLSAIPLENNAKVGGIGSAGVIPGPPGPVPPQVVGTCPIEGVKTCLSYAGDPRPDSICHHGDNLYWAGNSPACRYTIPWIQYPAGGTCSLPSFSSAACAPNPRVDPSRNNVCRISMKTPQQEYYGYALDVSNVAGTTVYLPEIGNVQEWRLTSAYTCSNSTCNWGYKAFFAAGDETNEYKLALVHTSRRRYDGNGSCGTDCYLVGDAISTLHDFGGGSGHVHIELMINGQPYKPEDYLCL